MKRTSADGGNFSKARFEVQDKTRLKKWFPNQCPSTIPRVNKIKGSTHNPKEESGTSPYVEKSPCTK